MPNTLKLSSNAAVAEFKHTAFSVPQKFAIFCSNFFVRGPVVIHPLRNASATSFISASVISGGEKLIFFI